MIQTQTRRNHASNNQYTTADPAKDRARENVSYNQQLLKSIQKKTIAPLINDYQANLAHKQRAMELADKTVEQSLRLRGLQSSAENRSPRRKSKPRHEAINRDADAEDEGDEREEFNMRNESQKYN